MSQMGIRPPVTFLDSNGSPAVDFRVYISQPFTDPKDESKQLVITDSASGEVVSNPFTVTMDGYPRNADGQRVNPVIQEQNYAILFESIGGAQQYSHQNITGDAFGVSAATTAMVDRVLNNFQSALALDMTGNDFIFIQSQTAGWEGTTAGPVNSYYSYKTGGEGPPGTGIFNLFFDAGGNEWEIADISDRPLVNEANISTNTADIATNSGNISTNTSGVLENTNELIKRKPQTTTAITSSNPTFTPDPDARSIEFTIIGGGGGGGGSSALGATTSSMAGSGGSGAMVLAIDTPPQSSYSIVIGAGGAPGEHTPIIVNGGDGGTTSVTSGSFIPTSGGGRGGVSFLGVLNTPSMIAGGIGGDASSSNAAIFADGNSASAGSVYGNAVDGVDPVGASLSGASFFGGAVINFGTSGATVAGSTGSAHGSGGSASATIRFLGGSFGGAGSNGVVIVKEIF